MELGIAEKSRFCQSFPSSFTPVQLQYMQVTWLLVYESSSRPIITQDFALSFYNNRDATTVVEMGLIVTKLSQVTASIYPRKTASCNKNMWKTRFSILFLAAHAVLSCPEYGAS